MVQLSDCRGASDVLAAFGVSAESTTDGSPLIGQGIRPDSWDDPRWPSLAAFDEVTGDRPAAAWCFDYHTLLANSSALRAAGLTDASPDPIGGVLGRDAQGKLTGVAYERAALLVWDAIPEPPVERRARLLSAALDDLRTHGYVELHDLKAQPWLPVVLRELEDPMKIGLWPLVKDLAAMAQSAQEWSNDRLGLGGGKIFVDGTLNSRTAAMLSPYADGPAAHPAGMLLMTEADVCSAIEQADALGLPIAAHAIGDRAVRTVLDALERVKPASRGYRIEHAELIDPEDIDRIVRLCDRFGLIVSVQPCHLLADIEALQRAVPDRLGRVLPIRTLIDAGLAPGVDLLFGSDTPIVRPHPEDSIRAAVDRKRPDSAAIAQCEAISETTAWQCFTQMG